MNKTKRKGEKKRPETKDERKGREIVEEDR